MRKYSKRTREDAALICAIAASGGVYLDGDTRWSPVYAMVRKELDDTSDDCLALAIRAYEHVRRERNGVWDRETDAEAEALLRTGWSP